MALLTEYFGGKPKIPAFVPVSVQNEQKKAIAGNLGVLGSAMELGAGVNEYNQAELDKMYAKAFGGYYDKIRSSISRNTADLVSGKIPSDVRDAIGRNSAGQSVYGGYGGTGMGRNLTARDLGLTSLDVMSKGVDSATRWMAASRAPTFDVTSMFVDPQFQTQIAIEERNAKFQNDFVREQWDWYGSFGQQSVRGENSLLGTAGTVAGAYFGGQGAGGESGGGGPQASGGGGGL